MIMRIFQVSVVPGKEEAFRRFFHEVAIPLMRETDGIVDVWPGTARADSPTEFGLVMLWRDLDSLKAFVGEDYQTPHIAPEEEGIVAHRLIRHYNLVDT